MLFPPRSARRAFPPLRSLTRPRLAQLLVCVVALGVLLAGCGSGAAAVTSSDTSALPPTQRPTYIFVAIGASETFGTGADRPATQNWPTDLGAHLPRGTQVVNLGVPGITAPEAVQGELPEALDANANLVTVWLGTNDIKDGVSLGDFQQGLDTILTQLASKTHAHVAVANIPDLTLLPFFNSYDHKQLSGEVQAWNKVVAQEITAHQDILLDVYDQSSELLGHSDYLSQHPYDGLHHSTLGYQQIADYFYQVLLANGVI
jgi:acyl-CoA thioesterase I